MPGTGNSTTTGAPAAPSYPLPKVPGAERPADSGRDSAATNPRGDLTPREEREAMPMAGQNHNYMSEALSNDKTNESGAQKDRAVEKAKESEKKR